MDIEQAIADLAIRKTLAKLSDSIARRDPVAHGECYAENGEWHAFGTITRGREAVVRHWSEIMTQFPFVRQTLSSLVIEVAGETAACRAYVDEILIMPDRSVKAVMGIYHTTFAREGGAWLVSVHRYDQVYFGPPSFEGKFFPMMDYGPTPYDPDPTRMTLPMDISPPDA